VPTYVVLIDWTQQCVANFADSVDRYEAARRQFEGVGAASRTFTGRLEITTS
jgi:uncharacterized protein with GYD domain